MPTPMEYRQQADECLELMKDSNEWYVKTALLELAIEFQKRAQKLDRIGAIRPVIFGQGGAGQTPSCEAR